MAQKAARKKGFRIPDRLATLTFEGSVYEGAEVNVRLNVPLGALLNVQSIADDEATVNHAVDFAGTALVSWNLIDPNGADIPADAEGVKQVPLDLVSMILEKWVEALAQVPAPLGQLSPNGNT